MSFIANKKMRKKESQIVTELDKSVTRNLTNYLGYDVERLLKETDCCIFGGAIRDSIANFSINDIDIITDSYTVFVDRLGKLGYNYIPRFSSLGISELYFRLHCIYEPKVFVKNEKIIQIIRPGMKSSVGRYSINDILSGIDISCCCVTYLNGKVFESRKNAIIHCQQKEFEVDFSAMMCHKNTVYSRIVKLEERGWKNIGYSSYNDKNNL